jgi:hypothetical protein
LVSLPNKWQTQEVKMRGFLVFENSDMQQVAAAADAINLIFRLRGIDGTAKWYWDDIVTGIEYGVRLDISGMPEENSFEQMHNIWQLCLQQWNDQEIRLEIRQ